MNATRRTTISSLAIASMLCAASPALAQFIRIELPGSSAQPSQPRPAPSENARPAAVSETRVAQAAAPAAADPAPVELAADPAGLAVRITVGGNKYDGCQIAASTPPLVAVTFTEGVEHWAIETRPEIAGLVMMAEDGSPVPGASAACIKASQAKNLTLPKGRYRIGLQLDNDDRRDLPRGSHLTLVVRPAKADPLLQVSTPPEADLPRERRAVDAWFPAVSLWSQLANDHALRRAIFEKVPASFFVFPKRDLVAGEAFPQVPGVISSATDDVEPRNFRNPEAADLPRAGEPLLRITGKGTMYLAADGAAYSLTDLGARQFDTAPPASGPAFPPSLRLTWAPWAALSGEAEKADEKAVAQYEKLAEFTNTCTNSADARYRQAIAGTLVTANQLAAAERRLDTELSRCKRAETTKAFKGVRELLQKRREQHRQATYAEVRSLLEPRLRPTP